MQGIYTYIFFFSYEDELAMSAIKREAVTLYEQLRVSEIKRNELLIEEQERGTPGQVTISQNTPLIDESLANNN